MTATRFPSLLVLACFLAGCPGNLMQPPVDGGEAPADGGVPDSGVPDSGTPDAGAVDSGLLASQVDPTLLPLATTQQVPRLTEYDALGVPQLPAGASYLDPSTGVRVYKLTSATDPAAAPGWVHDYSEGGDEVSLPYQGTTRAVLARSSTGAYWLLDFTPGQGVGNARQLQGVFAPAHDLCFTFSNDPQTPHFAYVSNGTTIRRLDLRSLQEAPGGGWPVTESDAVWLHQSENDGLFVWMLGANGNTVVAYEPSTGTRKTFVNANVNEPRIDRAGRYVGMAMNVPVNALLVWDFQTGLEAWRTAGDPGIPFGHNASLRRRWVVVDWNASYPPPFGVFNPEDPSGGAHFSGPANGTLVYGNGNWIQHPADLDDQWALFTHYGSLRPPESFWLAPGAMVLVTPNGGKRLLGHPYNTASDYTFYTFAKFSPDGRYVLFTSNMNGSSRSDLFLAELPTQ